MGLIKIIKKIQNFHVETPYSCPEYDVKTTEHIQGCLMICYGASDDSMEPQDGVILGREFRPTDTILLPGLNKAKRDSTLDKFPMKIKHESD